MITMAPDKIVLLPIILIIVLKYIVMMNLDRF